jgi:hypothetical protein
MNKPMSQTDAIRAANTYMKNNVDAMGRPKLSLQQAISEVRAAASGQEPGAQPGTPQPGTRPPASPNGGDGTRPTSDRAAIITDEHASEVKKLGQLRKDLAATSDADMQARLKAEVQRSEINIATLSREGKVVGRNLPGTVDGGASQTATQPASQPPANTGRVTPQVISWAKSSKSKGVDTKAMFAELKRQGYTKEESIQALRQGGY